jgi:ATP-binding cassette subfamily F protein 3
LGHLVVPGYQSQDFAETMAPDETVYRVVKQANPEVAERQLRTLLGGFGFEGDAIEKRVDVLSGGEKIRLAFARLFMRPPNLLLLDEPTTHLDIQGRQTLEQTLRDYAGTVVLVSHDVTFVRNVATNIIALQPPGLQRYVGGYDYYRERVGAHAVRTARGRGGRARRRPIRARSGAGCGRTSGASTSRRRAR